MNTTESRPTLLLDWQEAEAAAAEHMKFLGFIDAQRTSSGADGGIDVESSEAAAQVKFHASPVGRPDIQRLRGAAHEYRIGIFYSTGGYTREATHYADEAGVALFQMNLYGQAEATSQQATLLAESEHMGERRERLEKFKVFRYQLAAISFQHDLHLYAQFNSQVSLSPEESGLYLHVASALEQSLLNFETAVNSREFELADTAFDEINKRISFLRWITGSDLRESYQNLDEAVSDGWSLDSSPDSGFLLYRAASGVFDLHKLALDFLRDWEELLPEGATMRDLAGPDILMSAGLLSSATQDPSILSTELLHQLKEFVRAEVQTLHRTANEFFRIVIDKHVELGYPRPRTLVAGLLRVEALAGRIYQQLGAD